MYRKRGITPDPKYYRVIDRISPLYPEEWTYGVKYDGDKYEENELFGPVLNVVSLCGGGPMFDIRQWTLDDKKCDSSGVTLTGEQMDILVEAYLKYKENK